MKRFVIVGGLAAVAAGGWYYGRPVSAESKAPVAAAVAVAAEREIVAPGRVEPLSEEIEIAAEFDGRLVSVPVEEGDRVRKGQVIATLASADYAARVALAESAINERRAELERLRNGAREQERQEAAAVTNEGRAVLEQARVEMERRHGLLSRGAISRVEFESAERDYRVAEARVEAAGQREALVKADTRIEEIHRAEAEIASAEARAAEARAVLAKTAIVSPINGVVLRKFKHAGESAGTESVIVTLGDTSKLRVRMEIDETDVARVQVGRRVTVTAAAFGEKTFSGTVTRVGGILGRKNLRTDAAGERVDTKVLETLVDLDAGAELPIGLRVDAHIGDK